MVKKQMVTKDPNEITVYRLLTDDISENLVHALQRVPRYSIHHHF